MDDLKLALSEISKTLDSLVVGPPRTSLPAVRARYLVTLTKQLAVGDITYRQLCERIAEWDKKNRIP